MSLEDYTSYKRWAKKLLKFQIIEEAWDWRELYFEVCSEKQELVNDYNELVNDYNNLLEENEQLQENLTSAEEAAFHKRNDYLEQQDEFEHSYDNNTSRNTLNLIQQLESEVEFLKSELHDTHSFFRAMHDFEGEINIGEEPYMPGFPLRIPEFLLEGKPVFVIGATGNYFHRPGCQHLRLVKIADCDYFEFKKDAIKRGYKPCEICCV